MQIGFLFEFAKFSYSFVISGYFFAAAASEVLQNSLKSQPTNQLLTFLLAFGFLWILHSRYMSTLQCIGDTEEQGATDMIIGIGIGRYISIG